MLLVLGTRNRKKRQEIVDLLGDLGWELGDLNDWPGMPEVEETGTTFEENARIKAQVVARFTGHYALGEDSGLVVPALGGAPGVYSARYAGKQGDDAANNAKLLAELEKLPEDQRDAYYDCTAVLCDPAGEVKATVEGRCHGRIIRDARVFLECRTGFFHFRHAGPFVEVPKLPAQIVDQVDDFLALLAIARAQDEQHG